MEFICAHCGKTINCFGVVVDKQHFVHSTCETEFIETLEQIDKLFVGTEDENLTEVE